ncbi:MAG TPA: PAS domain-containing sensor histidine kinase, partial [Longimicrobiales bacterium]|nr:PAS domain-containing sensor histidine kinase [Longimicrobiales bacterium]
MKKHWTVSKYADLMPLLAFALVMTGVFFVDRERSGRVERDQQAVEQRAAARATVLGNELENAINERLGALTAAELQLTSVEDSVSQQTLVAALDSVTGRMTGLVGIAIIDVDRPGQPVRASGTMIGSPFGNIAADTALSNPYLRARATRRTTASGVIDFPVGRRVVVFSPVVRGDTAAVRNVIAGELDPTSVARIAASAVADSLQDVFWSLSGPNDVRLTSNTAPGGWPTVSKPVRVADSFWRVDIAYRPPETRLVRAERVAVWVAGTALALAIAAILFFLRRTINLQREELVRREAAEEAARLAAGEARQRAREARDLAVQLEAAQRAAQQLSTSLDPETVIEFLLGGVAEILSADVASLYTFEDEGEVLVGRRRMVFRDVPGTTDRLLSEDIRQVRAPVNMMPPHIVEAASTGEPYVNEGRSRERPLLGVTGGAEAPVASVTVPLLIAGRAVGVASWEIFSEPREFPPALVAFAQALAAPAAAALRTAELFSSLEEERERAQREALRFAALIDQMADGVIVVDAAGRLDRTNAAAAELLGEELSDNIPLADWPTRFGLVSADGRPMVASELPLTRALRGERVRRATFIVRSPWGTERHLSISAGPIVTPDGQPAGAAMVMRDISDEHQYAEMLRHTNRELRRQAEMLEEVNQQLRQATKAKDQFLAVMSHELRTPINAIMGYSDLLDLGVKGELNEDQRAMLSRVRETSKHLLGLINEVLDLAKIGAGRMDLVLVETDLGDIVTRASEQVAPLATAKGLELEVENVAQPITVKADETRLTQIVINLLSNAVKFTPSGSVRLSLRLHGDTAEVRVRDSGPGIPDEERERIFEEFYQVEGGFSRSSGGTGLGLAIARRFARLMGGDIRVESELGVGSEFIVRLPAA